MSNNMNVLVVGAGMMAGEYCKVIKALSYNPIVIGRGEDNAAKLEKELQIPVLRGGIEKNLSQVYATASHAIVAVDANQHTYITEILLNAGIKNILVEKPAGVDCYEMKCIATLAKSKKSNVYVAYNRRFYASTQKALEIIQADGGVTSFSFEFTEWGHVIEKTTHPQDVKEKWFLANSTHVVDLAFFLGGFPKEMNSYVQGSLDWHKCGSIYVGAGISEKGALFSYQANWAAPGRWSVEVLTQKHRLYLKPLEKLQIQDIGSVTVEPVEIDDKLDLLYKPGLYCETESFLKGYNDGKKITIAEQLEHMQFYEKMEGKTYKRT